MTTLLLVILVIFLWVAIGVIAVVHFLGRQGYRSWHWYLVGGILGLLFVPIAADRARRDTRVLERTPGAQRPAGAAKDGLTVVVGTDGSPEGDQAVRDTAELIAGTAARVILVTVVDAEAHRAEEQRAAAREMLQERLSWLPGNGDSGTAEHGPETMLEIGSGQPANVLLTVAESEGADLVVIGRRGKGLSQRVLGSVANEVLKHFPRPVLFSCPTKARR
ncbi:universal stress protein [Streptomyces sp. 549]|uniref:universal stress protein n=1 Tax=Streptomyces sp. 549 TaxID=3049076 RepID=UPI0024C3D12A|nr:universal stress protein [Streptomyces sp. 549]MDK1476588.1 universal stress protein [Streptomyces sp. 549]